MAAPQREKVISYGDFYKNDALSLSRIGYHDFHYIKPLTVMHKQEGHTFHIVIDGKGELHVGGEVYRLGAHDVFYLPPDEPMMYFPDHADPWRYYWFHVYGKEAGALAARLGLDAKNPVRRCPEPDVILRLCESLFRPDLGSAECYFNSLSALYRLVGSLSVKDDGTPKLRTSDIVEETKSLIGMNYRNPDFGVDELARMAHVSHSYLCKLFREATGLSPVGYLCETRLSAAAALLASSASVTVKELCTAVGGRDEIHFMKAFKKRFGMTVSEYKQAIKKPGSV